MTWLLIDAADATSILNEPNTMIRDSHGDPWLFFDLDGTLVALRRRGLPEHSELPEAERLVDETYAVEGYSGRKRAEIQMCRETLQHAGSGLWLGLWCSPGNGDKRESVSQAAQVVASVMAGNELSDRGVIRMDGGYGTWWVIEACNNQGVHYVTRWNHLGLLTTEKIETLRAKRDWVRVRDSLSGPVRYATDIGWLTSDDGTQRTRLVCTRYRDETGKGVGLSIGGWRYELFATHLPLQCWSAAQVACLFYGRVGQENRFGQEDKELGLDRIFSKNLAAQTLASLVGLFVWNLQIVFGWNLVRASSPASDDVLPPQAPRNEEVLSEEAKAGQPNPLVMLLESSVDWPRAVPQNWQWESGYGLRCPAGYPMHLKRVMDAKLIFRAAPERCNNCASRSSCTNSTQPRLRREIHVTPLPGKVEQIRSLKRRGMKSHSILTSPSNHRLDTVTVRYWSPPSDIPAGPLELAGPYLIPSVLRQEFRHAAQLLEVIVHVTYHRPSPPPKHLALTDARRQRRRLTWTERNAWNALPDDASLSIIINGWCEDDLNLIFRATGARLDKGLKIAV